MPFKLKSRFEEHLSRRVFHALSGTIIALLFAYVFDRETSRLLTIILVPFFLIIEFLRFRWRFLNRLAFKVMGSLMRERETREASAQIFYILGFAWAILFLPRAIAIQVILITAWLDPVAGIFGVRFGDKKWASVLKIFDGLREDDVTLKKTLFGSAMGGAAAFLAGLVAWTGPWAYVEGAASISTLQVSELFLLSIVGTLVGVIAELWPSQWDDNIKIPIWSGLALWLTVVLLGIPYQYT